MDNDNKPVAPVVSLRDQMAMREALKAAEEAAKKSTAPDPSRTYEVKIQGVEQPFRVTGVVVLTPAFFAVGVPTDDDGFDFNFSAPIERIEYILNITPPVSEVI